MNASRFSSGPFMAESEKRVYANDSLQDVRDYFFYILLRRKWLIMFISIAGIALAAAGTYLCTPLYEATSKMMIRSNISQEVVLFNDLYQQVARSPKVIPGINFIELAGSELFARMLVEKFKLDEKLRRQSEEPENFREYFWYYVEKAKDWVKVTAKYPYNLYQELTTGEKPETSKPDYKILAVKKFLADMTDIDLVADSDIISLSIWAESPGEAEAIAKELSNLVIQKSISFEQDAASYGYDFCRAELENARKELAIADQKLYQFKQKRNIIKIEKQKEIKLNELDNVEKNLISVNTDLSSQKAKMEESIRQLDKQREVLTSLDSYEGLLGEIISLKVDINGFMAQKQEYELAKAQTKAALGELVEKELELTRLKREAALKEAIFSELSSKHDKLKIQRISNLCGVDFRMIDIPELLDNAEPDWPFWDLNMLIGVPISIFLAIGFAFLLELSNESFWRGGQIEKRLNIPFLGTISEIKVK
ncbi:MAG: hypothetical protein IMF11_05175 [Proteobacteria bacterium]|nr:hypothetical protein [Pseudomonadota bacterium]